MGKLTWTWQDYWVWFHQIESKKGKANAWLEVLGGKWMGSLPVGVQVEIFRYAPTDVLEVLKHFPDDIKYETLVKLDREINGKRGRYR